MAKVTIVTGEPTVSVIAAMQLDLNGIDQMVDWVATHRPECLPWDNDADRPDDLHKRVYSLFPHNLYAEDGRILTDNELLVELAGRKCYDSFGNKAGKKSNAAYIANTQMHVDPVEKAADITQTKIVDENGFPRHPHAIRDEIAGAIRDAQNSVPHASILYHAKLSFFIAGVSRRVSHELIRNYVGADRDEEGSPSQESTRYTEHYGFYVAHPRYLNKPARLQRFTDNMQMNYANYLEYVRTEYAEAIAASPNGKLSTIEKKRVLESASPELSHACETSWIWTTNPGAIAKMIKERDTEGADLEFRRLARKLKRVSMAYAPNLFPQPWMRER